MNRNTKGVINKISDDTFAIAVSLPKHHGIGQKKIIIGRSH